jgi:DNA-damage-inducible protein J
MPTADIVRARVDTATKKEASEILDSMGITMSDAIRMMLVQVVAQKALPFDVRVPNAATRDAIEASRRGDTSRFSSIDDLMDDLDD